MSTGTLDKPKKKKPQFEDAVLTKVGLQVLKALGTPPLFSSIATKALWSEGAGDSMVSYYRVNIYCFTGEAGMIPRIQIGDRSFFIKCDHTDTVITKLEKKYG